ncbi:hypothetical protein [Fodinicola acaciae]|uniref:hypothetical protein n=1 Tax=Fodinicola acaciae TaxID=2681555 RepID=UPI0013D4E90C|nr:hypothetical protein [Fodinicola acaciae]
MPLGSPAWKGDRGRSVVFPVRRSGARAPLPACCVRHGRPTIAHESFNALQPTLAKYGESRRTFALSRRSDADRAYRATAGFSFPVSISGWPFCPRCLLRRRILRWVAGGWFFGTLAVFAVMLGASGYFGLALPEWTRVAAACAAFALPGALVPLRASQWDRVARLNSNRGAGVEVTAAHPRFLAALGLDQA